MGCIELLSYDSFRDYVAPYKKVFIICGYSSLASCCSDLLDSLRLQGISYDIFSEFTPNPTTEDVDRAIEMFSNDNYDAIISIGGGSAIDVGKCVKMFCHMGTEDWENKLKSVKCVEKIPLIAMPTTAGSGAEATSFAVIYYSGVKQSVSAKELLPNAVLFDGRCLSSLPLYQKKATVLDALGHCIESYWSVHSTKESKSFAETGIRIILEKFEDYLDGKSETNEDMQRAAYLAGKAINVTKTTAGHAMAYKLTTLYGFAHGHAVALCLRVLWPWMIRNTAKCCDERGREYLEGTFDELATIFGCKDAMQGAERYGKIVGWASLAVPRFSEEDISVLTNSVNPLRMSNNPIKLERADIENLYRGIMKNESR